MKFIGQFIQNFIARFRSDVYLENVSESTQDHVVGIDANGKLYKQDAASGDITAVNVTAPITGGGSSGDVTVAIQDASTSVKGAARFSSDNFSVSSGAVTIKSGGIDLTDEVTGVLPSANLDADTAHLSTQKHMTHHSFTADIDTTKHYVGLVDADSESTVTTGIDMPLVFPVASKLLQVTLRSNKNLSALTYTWRLETQATGVGFGTGPTIVGTQSGAGPEQVGHTTYDFTTSLDSGDNVIDAFDAVYLSIQSSGSTANTKYYITCVWETNMSSY